MDLDISNAWRQASADLGIRVEAPIALTAENGETVLFEAHILDFGGPKGTVVAGKEGDWGGIRKSLGYYYSSLFPTYRVYARRHFINTLNDWGWFGEENQRPAWYTGKPWS